MVAHQERKTIIIGKLLRPILPPYPQEIKTSNLLFMNENNVDDYDYDEYDTIIITADTRISLSQQDQTRLVILVERSINKALKKGMHICILCNDPDDPLFRRVLSNLNVRFIKSSQHISEISVRRSEFNTFLNKYGTAFGIYSGECGSIIATTSKVYVSPLLLEEIIKADRSGEYIVGFTRKKENGMITFLPFFILPNWAGVDDRKSSKLVSELRQCLETHRKNIEIEPPIWKDQIKLKKEKDLELQVAESEKQIAPKKELLEKQYYFKSILWLKHDELRDRCMAVLNEMGIHTRKDDIGIEDFWILNSSDKEICICEVKGKDGDLVKTDLLKFQANIDAAGKDELFPSLLIANTHNKSNTLDEKDKRAPSNVIEHAVRNRILIMRTLDLIKLLDMYQDRKLMSDKIMKKIIRSTGWLRIDKKIELMQK